MTEERLKDIEDVPEVGRRLDFLVEHFGELGVCATRRGCEGSLPLLAVDFYREFLKAYIGEERLSHWEGNGFGKTAKQIALFGCPMHTL